MRMSFAWYLRHRYSFLLLALLLLFVLHPIARSFAAGRLLFDVLLTLVFIAVFLALFKRRSYRLAGIVLGTPTVFANWVGYLLPGLPALPLNIAFHVLTALFLGFTAVTILIGIHEADEVSADSIAGAFTGYVLIGLVFGHIFCIVEGLAPGSYHVPPDLASEMVDVRDRRTLLVYYSYITLTTVGYGDILPKAPIARELAGVEAITGQFYIAVVMAELIALKVSRPRTPSGRDAKE